MEESASKQRFVNGTCGVADMVACALSNAGGHNIVVDLQQTVALALKEVDNRSPYLRVNSATLVYADKGVVCASRLDDQANVGTI